MNNAPLETRVDRLREAIQNMFGHDVSYAQSLELVTSLDKDCVRHECREPSSATMPGFSLSEISTHITQIRDQNRPNLGAKDIFQNHRSELDRIKRMICPIEPGGALLIIGGRCGNGKTTTASAIINHSLKTFPLSLTDIHIEHCGIYEVAYAKNAILHEQEASSFFERIRDLNPNRRFVVIDDIDSRLNSVMAMNLAVSGFKVILVQHGVDCESILSTLVEYSGGELLDSPLSQLAAKDRLHIMHQSIVSS
jgi:ABC-type glutathione transport system ATPase component